jgi:hypothetical protein
MSTTRPHRRQGTRALGRSRRSAGHPPPGAGRAAPGPERRPRRTSRSSGAPRLQMAAHQGRLSVDLWEADLEEGLAQIHQQAGIAISVSLRPEHTVSMQFTDVALDQGRHRLLQLASQSCAMRYAPGPTGEVTLQEVQVFAEAPAGDQSSAGPAWTSPPREGQ